MTFRKSILCSTLFPVAFGFTVGMVTPCRAEATNPKTIQLAANPCAAVRAPNPCAAKNPCAANPCAANPCAAKNPCAANPCAANPCAANPCAANPCAANPCAANPCAANPCAANPCAANPCAANPCAAADVELTPAQAKSEWARLMPTMKAAYAKAGLEAGKMVFDYENLSTEPYVSGTHGGRYVMNIINDKAAGYKKYEDAPKLPEGAILVKPSMMALPGGKGAVGPLFVMEKMASGWNAASWDWKYSMVMPNGTLWGETKGKNAAGMNFCIDCHNAAGEDTDGMLFQPEEYRK